MGDLKKKDGLYPLLFKLSTEYGITNVDEIHVILKLTSQFVVCASYLSLLGENCEDKGMNLLVARREIYLEVTADETKYVAIYF